MNLDELNEIAAREITSRTGNMRTEDIRHAYPLSLGYGAPAQRGLSKREYFAAKAMAALLGSMRNEDGGVDTMSISRIAVKAADHLLFQLGREL